MRLKPCELVASFLRREDACDRFIDPGGLHDRDDKYSNAFDDVFGAEGMDIPPARLGHHG
jgi:hypothetical protein